VEGPGAGAGEEEGGRAGEEAEEEADAAASIADRLVGNYGEIDVIRLVGAGGVGRKAEGWVEKAGACHAYKDRPTQRAKGIHTWESRLSMRMRHNIHPRSCRARIGIAPAAGVFVWRGDRWCDSCDDD
jgi:hypothetical protein